MEQQLIVAATSGDAAGIAVALAAAAALEPASRQHALGRALDAACRSGHAGCARQLLAAGTDPNSLQSDEQAQWRPLHTAAMVGSTVCVELLLAAGGTPVTLDSRGNTALHTAENAGTARLLLRADQEAAKMRNNSGHTPLQAAIMQRRTAVALCLVAYAPLQPAAEIQASLRSAIWTLESGWVGAAERDQLHDVETAIILLAARLDLDFTECSRQCGAGGVLMVSSHLAVWLPALVQRSEAAAGRLMRLLSLPDRQRLRSTALCLARIERGLTKPMPTPIMHRLLAESAALHALGQPHTYASWTAPFSWKNGGEQMALMTALCLAFLALFAGVSWLLLAVLKLPWMAYGALVALFYWYMWDPEAVKLLFACALYLCGILLVFVFAAFLLSGLSGLLTGVFDASLSPWQQIFGYIVLYLCTDALMFILRRR